MKKENQRKRTKSVKPSQKLDLNKLPELKKVELEHVVGAKTPYADAFDRYQPNFSKAV